MILDGIQMTMTPEPSARVGGDTCGFGERRSGPGSSVYVSK